MIRTVILAVVAAGLWLGAASMADPAQTVLDDLVIYMPYDEGDGTTTTDLSGNGYDGKLFCQMYNPNDVSTVAMWGQPINSDFWVQGKWGFAIDFTKGIFEQERSEPNNIQTIGKYIIDTHIIGDGIWSDPNARDWTFSCWVKRPVDRPTNNASYWVNTWTLDALETTITTDPNCIDWWTDQGGLQGAEFEGMYGGQYQVAANRKYEIRYHTHDQPERFIMGSALGTPGGNGNGQWQNILITVKGDPSAADPNRHEGIVYVNGTPISKVTNTGGGTGWLNCEAFMVGMTTIKGGQCEDQVDDVAAWNRILTPEEIAWIQTNPIKPTNIQIPANAVEASDANLVAWYHFEEGPNVSTTGNFLFSEASGTTTADSSAIAAVGTLLSGAGWLTGGIQFDGTANARINVVKGTGAWDGVYWSNAGTFTLIWDVDIKTSQVPTATNGAGILMFTDTSLASGSTHIRGNKILAMDAAGKLFVAGNSISNNSAGQPTTSYKTGVAVNDGLQHHVRVVWDIAPGGTLTTPLFNDTVTIYVDGVSRAVVPNFDWNQAPLMWEMNSDPAGDHVWPNWVTPGMIFGQNIKTTAWQAYNGWMDNVKISMCLAPASIALPKLGNPTTSTVDLATAFTAANATAQNGAAIITDNSVLSPYQPTLKVGYVFNGQQPDPLTGTYFAASGSKFGDPNVFINGLTLSAWIKPADSHANWGIIATKGGYDGMFSFHIENNKIYGLVSLEWTDEFGVNYEQLRSDTSEGTIGPNVWQHVTMVWNPADVTAQLRFYINGKLKTSNAVVAGGPNSKLVNVFPNEPFMIGNPYAALQLEGPDLNYRPFRGGIDDVRLYNRPLTADEILGLNFRWCLGGDLSGDCKVDMADIDELSLGWKSTYGMPDLVKVARDWLDSGYFPSY